MPIAFRIPGRSRPLRSPSPRDWRELSRIHAEWQQVTTLSAAGLRAAADALRPFLCNRIEPETVRRALALAAEAAHRATGKRYYDVQLLGGLVLSRGCIAEMQTGEGKTLTTLLPAVVHGLTGRGVHVATTNSYLAARDHGELKGALALLGMTSAVLPEQHNEPAKRLAYGCDVTFGTGYDFGFDFLRDQILARQREQSPLGTRFLQSLAGRSASVSSALQRQPATAIIDEADSVLIDEGSMPLILSGSGGEPPAVELLRSAAAIAATLVDSADVLLDPERRSIRFTQQGWARIHQSDAARRNGLLRPWSIYVENALRAARFLQRDIDYVIRDREVQIVDPLTGRIHRERSWRDGLHQAVEFSCGVPLTPERRTDARVTRQRFFQRYPVVTGLTGTAAGVEGELREFYRVDTVVIPPHRPCLRQQLPVRCFSDDSTRNAAIVDEVRDQQARGRPVLVGTRTILHSRRLSALLADAGIAHELLNGVQDRQEAEIIALAGRAKAVTIATNMAGRGTDIRLDPAARTAGGLHVIAAEHHASRRVDRQLAGRAGRQGDPGSCRVFASVGDELLQTAPRHLVERLQQAGGQARGDLTSELRAIQEELERRSYLQRRQMVQRDRWLDDVLESLAATRGSE